MQPIFLKITSKHFRVEKHPKNIFNMIQNSNIVQIKMIRDHCIINLVNI